MRTRALLVTFLLVVAPLAACGDDDASVDGDAAATSSTEPVDEPGDVDPDPTGPDGPTVSMVFRVVDGPLEDGAVDELQALLEQRLAALGLEAEVAIDGDDVTISGVPADEAVVEVVGGIAVPRELAFRPVLALLPPVDGAPALTGPDDDAIDRPVVLAMVDPTTGDEVQRLELGPTTLDGSIVADAEAVVGAAGSWMVGLVLDDARLDDFNALAGACFDRSGTCPTGQLAIVLDHVVVSAPAINAPSFEVGDISISGDFTAAEARDLALALRVGVLPAELELVETVDEPA